MQGLIDGLADGLCKAVCFMFAGAVLSGLVTISAIAAIAGETVVHSVSRGGDEKGFLNGLTMSFIKYSGNDGLDHLIRPRPVIEDNEIQWAALVLDTKDYFIGHVQNNQPVDHRHIGISLDFHYAQAAGNEGASRRASWFGRGIIISAAPGCELRFENFNNARVSECISVEKGIQPFSEYHFFLVASRSYLAVEIWSGDFHQPQSERLLVSSVDTGSYGCIDWNDIASCGLLFDGFIYAGKQNSHVVVGDIGGVPGTHYEVRAFLDGRYIWNPESARMDMYRHLDSATIELVDTADQRLFSSQNRLGADRLSIADFADYEFNMDYELWRIFEQCVARNGDC